MIDYVLSRLAPAGLLLIEPIGLIWLTLIALTLALLWKRRSRFAIVTAALVVFISVVGGSSVPALLLGRLERPYAGLRPAELPVCDAVVQLGGCVQPSLLEAGQIHLTFTGDRVLMGLELARLGKAPVLCVSGGYAPPGSPTGHEADVLKAAIDERGLTTAEVVSLGGCFDTGDEARRVAKLAQERGWRHILLVTSAAHMRRALGAFRQQGLDVIPVPCNFLTDVGAAAPSFRIGLPHYGGFFLTSVWLHEEIGYWEYRRRGWIGAPAKN